LWVKRELKPFVKMFKPVTVEEALEYALYVEEANECQFKKFKSVPRVPFTVNSVPLKQNTEKFPAILGKQPTPMINKNLIEQRRALGQCFKCGDKYFPEHQCKIKVQMLIGNEEEMPMPEKEGWITLEEDTKAEEAIVSMHATTSNPKPSTMKFKGYIGKIPVTALVDSGSTHSFVNPVVLKGQNCQIMETHPMVVMVANGEKMVTDSKCESLLFSIQGTKFNSDLRLLPIQGYDVILGLDWLSQWGDMQINWHDKWLKFQREDQEIKL
jgi:Retroviral aspartyl protease